MCTHLSNIIDLMDEQHNFSQWAYHQAIICASIGLSSSCSNVLSSIFGQSYMVIKYVQSINMIENVEELGILHVHKK